MSIQHRQTVSLHGGLRPDADDGGRRERAARTAEEVADLRARLARQEAELASLRREVALMGASLSNRQDALEIAAHDLVPGSGAAERLAYLGMTQRLRRLTERVVPSDGRVVVVGKGVEDLTRTIGRRAEHLSQAADGSYPYFNPSSSRAAIAQVEAARWGGAGYLVIPAVALWWLDGYADFARHLERRYVLVGMDEEAGGIWSLRDRSRWRDLEDLLDACAARAGRRPTVLDWHTGLELEARFPECAVFSPVDDGPSLPYLDRSIDVVAVGGAGDEAVIEARRVACSAVVDVGSPGGAVEPTIVWRRQNRDRFLSGTSIVVHARSSEPVAPEFVDCLVDGLTADFQGEILLSTGQDQDVTHRLGSGRDVQVRTRVVRHKPGSSWSERMLQVAETSSEDNLVFLDAQTLPVPGWLPPLRRILVEDDGAGVACGMLVEPDGRVVSAGGVVIRGTPMGIGEGDYAVDSPRYCHVRPVDFCSSSLLATRRDLFLAVGGFDDDDPVGSGLGYCTRIRAAGRRTVYQPDTLAVDSAHG